MRRQKLKQARLLIPTQWIGLTFSDDGQQYEVTIAKPFAVSKFEVTFAEWDLCFALGGCKNPASDSGWKRGRRPVINVSWSDAQEYVAWLSKLTGKPYRLLTEAEWEYAARGGTTTAYFWGDDIGKGNANCDGCGSQWDNKQTAPVGSFKPNGFGLHDMHGNVWEWVRDCDVGSYKGAPTDGRAAPDKAGCSRVLRGGSWVNNPQNLRAARRGNYLPVNRVNLLGFRLASTIIARAGGITVLSGAHISSTIRDGHMLSYLASVNDCRHCRLKPTCCASTPQRKVTRSIYEPARDVARAIAQNLRRLAKLTFRPPDAAAPRVA